MRVRWLFAVIASLLAIGTSTSVPAAGPDWPKSLTLVTASPGGIYYVYGEALAQILTEKLGIAVNPLAERSTHAGDPGSRGEGARRIHQSFSRAN
jgi:TRAP-type uncharacterized transport system substrate-binding protein